MKKLRNTVCDEDDFTLLVKSNTRQLVNYAFYRGVLMSDAQDMVQEAFIKLWANCGKVPFNKAVPFLNKVLNNIIINNYEHKKVVLKFARNKKTDISVETPEFLLEKKEFSKKLSASIANLPEGQREVFLMNRIDKKTYAQIAEELNISQKAVEKRMHKALVKLRKLTTKI